MKYTSIQKNTIIKEYKIYEKKLKKKKLQRLKCTCIISLYLHSQLTREMIVIRRLVQPREESCKIYIKIYHRTHRGPIASCLYIIKDFNVSNQKLTHNTVRGRYTLTVARGPCLWSLCKCVYIRLAFIMYVLVTYPNRGNVYFYIDFELINFF